MHSNDLIALFILCFHIPIHARMHARPGVASCPLGGILHIRWVLWTLFMVELCEFIDTLNSVLTCSLHDVYYLTVTHFT